MTPTREIYWNVEYGWLVYPLSLVMLAVLGYGMWRRARVWRRGAPSPILGDIGARARAVLAYAVGQARVVRSPVAGILHLLLYSGFGVLFIGTLLIALQEDFHIPFLRGDAYLFYSLILDVFGALAIVGAVGLACRRYLQRPPGLDSGWDDAVVLAFVAAVLVTGYVVEGLRIGATELGPHPSWLVWSPLGTGVAVALTSFGVNAGGFRAAHAVVWWVHAFLATGLVAYFGWSKLTHALLAPATALLRPTSPRGALRAIADFKDPGSLGVGRFSDLSFAQRLRADTCIHAGRCEDNCPAFLSGKPLDPKKLLVGLQGVSARARADRSAEDSELVGDVISEDAIWACTTCGACSYQCPVLTDPLDLIVDLRRRQVMGHGRMPESAQVAMLNLQKRGHPWVGTKFTRTDWMEGRSVPRLGDLPAGAQVDVLFWVGCSGALVERNIRTTQAIAHLLSAAGVRFAVLGDEETCTGDPARRIGQEFLFQQLAKRNIKTLDAYGIKRVVTGCPHCFNTLKNEYPQLGGTYEVIHHTELLADLVRQGRLRATRALTEQVTYHDPCYLGRYNDRYDAPREVIAAIPGATVVEMDRTREKGFCCGAGGGHAFFEEKQGRRINHMRSEEALSTGATVLASACPFCLQMFDEGLASVDGAERMRAMDVAEMLVQGLDAAERGENA